MLSSRHFATALAGLVCVLIARSQTLPISLTWNSTTSSDFTNTANWTGGTLTNSATANVVQFGPGTFQFSPNVTSSFSVAGITYLTGVVAPTPSYTLSGSGGAVLTIGSSGITNQTGTNAQTISVPIVFAGSSTVSNEGALTISGGVTNNGGLSVSGAGNTTFSGVLGGTGSLTVNGAGTAALSAANTFTGTTILFGGTLQLGNVNALQLSDLDLQGGSVNFGALTAATIGGLDGFSNLALANSSAGAVNLTVANSFTASLYSGVLSGAGGLIKSGTGSLRLDGANTYAGGTTINAGTLIVNNSSGSGTGTGDITVVSGGTLQIGDGAGGAVSGNITNNARVVFGSTNSVTYGGVISGNGSLDVGIAGFSTGGSLTLTAANTYSGATNLQAGILTIGAANTLPTSTRLWFSTHGSLNVANNQTVAAINGTGSYGAGITLGTGATLTVAATTGNYGGTFDGTIGGAGNLVIAGATGTSVTITGNNTFTGNTTVSSGTLYATGNASLGSGGLVLVQTGAALSAGKGVTTDVKITNPVALASGATLGGGKNASALAFSGTVTVPSGTSTVHLSDLVKFSGTLKSASTGGQLTFDAASGFPYVVFTGAIDPSLATLTASATGLVFGSSTAVPSAGALLIKGSNAYVGITSVSGSTVPTANSVLTLIDRPNFNGAFGFDTFATSGALASFSDPIDVSLFGSTLTLGSASAAVISGTITPSSSGYLFGNGGGALVVSSALTGANNVTVSSLTGISGNYLLSVFRGANSYAGNLSVANSLAVFDSASALPAGRTISLGAYGYAGYTEAFTGVTGLKDFIVNRIVPGGYTATSVIGIDSNAFISDQVSLGYSSSSYRSFSDTIDLRSLSSVYLGTATRATLSGQIYAPTQSGANQALSLLGARGGELTISSPLVSGQVGSVVIGSSGSTYAGGMVLLTGANTYTGGTTLQSGALVVGGSITSSTGSPAYSALGTGALVVPSTALNPRLVSKNSYLAIDNPISLGTALQVGVPYLLSTSGLPFGDTTNTRLSMLYGYNNLVLNGVISDVSGSSGSLDIYGFTTLGGANTFSGGVNLRDGTLTLGNDSALGTGTLTLLTGLSTGYFGTTLSSHAARTIGNQVVYAGAPKGTVTFGGMGSLTFTNQVTLNSAVSFAPSVYAAYFNGSITGGGRLLSSGNAPIFLNGSNSYSGGTEATTGSIVFGSATAMPSSPAVNAFTAADSGYIGVSFVPSNLQTSFINRFNKPGTLGAIGFDSTSLTTPNTFNSDIDLRGFGSTARLGSTSNAILTGTIIPQGTTYKFGNGGGLLQVQSALTDSTSGAQSLDVTSYWHTPLTVRLTGTGNNFSGSVTVSNSGLIFGAGALPGGTTLFPFYSAYIGTEDATLFAANPTNFVTRFSPSATNAIIGFDSFGASPFLVSGNLSLASFTSTSDPAIILGTATGATLAGTITLPANQGAYRFAGYKGGQLTVQSTLTDSGATPKGVIVGDTSIGSTFTNPSSPGSALSAVTLSGTNTYTGGTTLNAGILYVANDSALGTGTLSVSSNYTGDGRHLELLASGANRSLANAVALSSSALDVGGTLNLALTGAITGTSSSILNKIGTGTLTLSGANSGFAGTYYVTAGSLVFQTASSVGTGMLDFDSTSGANVTFADNITINGIGGYNSADTITLTAGKTLTIHQTMDYDYRGTIIGSTGGLVIAGTNGLRLSGGSSFTGTTRIDSGAAVLVANANALGASTNAVTLNGGKLALESGVTFSNPLTFTSGKLAGEGTFKLLSGSTGYTIGTGMVISPGYHGSGTLTFDGSLIATSVLILSGGGEYHWGLLDATNASGGWGKVVVSGNVNIAASAGSQFTFKIGSFTADGSSGFAANFDPTQSYSWPVLTASSITGFDPNAFNIIGGVVNPNSGSFSLGLDGSGTSLMLNFSPVPEPSTYALIAAGLGLTLLVSRRRRR